LLTALLSLVLPLCVITVHKTIILQGRIPIPANIEDLQETALQVFPWWYTALSVIFFLGMVAVLIKIAVSVSGVLRIIRKGRVAALDTEGTSVSCGRCKLIISKENIAPFSWMKYIVISENDFIHETEDGRNIEDSEIFIHEKAHVCKMHSLDVLAVDLISSFQWFNPAIWMLRSDLRAIHEYEADEAVLKHGIDAKQYQYLLIRKAMADAGYSVANSFSHSTLKNRITMMLSVKSSFARAMKALYIIPLAGLSLAATAKTVNDYVSVSPEINVAAGDSVKKPVNVNIVMTPPGDTAIVYYIDGKKVSKEAVYNFDPKDIKSVNVDKSGAVPTIRLSTVSGGKVSTSGICIVGKKSSKAESGKTAPGSTSSVKVNKDGDSCSVMVYTVSSSAKDLDKAEIYIDGVKATRKEMDKIAPDTIKSINVDKKGNVIKITTKYVTKAK
jgi:beta-lactamase regulating signal transducer with metallopeptidase domain